MTADVKQDRFLRLPEVLSIAGVSRTTIFRWVRDGKFPAFYKLGDRAIGWSENDVTGWVEEKRGAAA